MSERYEIRLADEPWASLIVLPSGNSLNDLKAEAQRLSQISKINYSHTLTTLLVQEGLEVRDLSQAIQYFKRRAFQPSFENLIDTSKPLYVVRTGENFALQIGELISKMSIASEGVSMEKAAHAMTYLSLASISNPERGMLTKAAEAAFVMTHRFLHNSSG